MKRYFAYGSNLSHAQMVKRCPQCEALGPAVLAGYRWYVTARGYASLLPSTRDRVFGLVYSISDTDEVALDRYEGIAAGAYVKSEVTVRFKGEDMSCMLYVDPIAQEGRPKKRYAAAIRKGIKDAKLPADYVKKYLEKYLVD
ncbi:MAG: gamma-glutamylcyclotransferase [Opitutae bacterium]|nr:gamma-glutamylcyclotransferase [Opitutae bacterium]